MPLTSTGFEPYRYDEIKSDLESELAVRLGRKIDIRPDSAIGVLISVVANRMADLAEAQQSIYASMYPHQATGVNLDNAIAFTNQYRNPAAQSTVKVSVKATNGTALPDTFAVKSSTGQRWSISAATTVNNNSADVAYIQINTIQNSTVYSVSIGSNVYSVTSSSSATEQSILNQLLSTVPGSTLVDNVLAVDATNNASFVITNNLKYQYVSKVMTFTCEEYGPVTADAGTVTEIDTGVTGVDSVTNRYAANEGRYVETDQEIRARYWYNVYSGGGSTEAIKSALLLIDGVTNVTVMQNDQDIEVNSMAPHSIEAVVQGGYEDEIAQTIIAKKAAGIATNGDVSVELIDSAGWPQTILFNRPEEHYFWIKVTYSTNSEENFTSDGDSLIKSAIQSFEIDVGEDVIYQKLINHIYNNVTGIGEITFEMFESTDDEATPIYIAQQNFAMNTRQLAVFDADRVTTTFAP